MRLPFLLDTIGLVLMVTFIVTQMVVPLWCGRHLFPMFSRRRRGLHRHLVESNEETDLSAIERDLKRAQRRTLK